MTSLCALFLLLFSSNIDGFHHFWLVDMKDFRLHEYPAEDLKTIVSLQVRKALRENPYFRISPAPENTRKGSREKRGIQICFDQKKGIVLFVGVTPLKKIRDQSGSRNRKRTQTRLRAEPEVPQVDILDMWDKIELADEYLKEKYGNLFQQDKTEQEEAFRWRAKIYLCTDPGLYRPMIDLLAEEGAIPWNTARQISLGAPYYSQANGSIYCAPFPGEARLTHEVIHMLVHLLSAHVMSTKPFWLREGLAWDVEKMVLGTHHCCCNRAGFVYARAKNWEQDNTGALEMDRYLGLKKNPTDKDLVGILRFCRLLLEKSERFSAFLADLERMSVPVEQIEIKVYRQGIFHVRERPASAPLTIRSQKMLLLKHFGSLSGKEASLVAKLEKIVMAHRSNVWIRCFKTAVREHPRKKSIFDSGMVLAVPGLEEALSPEEICALEPESNDVEKLLEPVEKPFARWMESVERRLR